MSLGSLAVIVTPHTTTEPLSAYVSGEWRFAYGVEQVFVNWKQPAQREKQSFRL